MCFVFLKLLVQSALLLDVCRTLTSSKSTGDRWLFFKDFGGRAGDGLRFDRGDVSCCTV